MNEKIIIEMGSHIISIEFGFSFPTIYHNVMYANGKVPPKIMLLYGGISSYWAGKTIVPKTSRTGKASASARTRQKLACIKSIDAVMLITQYGISAHAVSEEINADHMPLPWHG